MFQFQNTIQHMDLSARSHTLVHRIKMRQPLKHSQFGMDMNILIMPILVKSTLTLDRHLIIPLMFYVVIQIAVSNKLSTSIYDLVHIYFCHFHHQTTFCEFIEILVLTSWILHPRILLLDN